ncbi:MAG: glycosyltransferase family 39 protein [Thermoguttaceae bacterium]|nr:glycosyltransferase family 39 protein [Thermoguttaceae bacterium]MDW8039094.1 glycosyltransferase family 39 protein [Thermoguttaceae bacterium]
MQFPSSLRGWPEGLWVAAFAFLVRAVVLLLVPNALQADPDGYRTVGENLLQHRVLGHGNQPTAVRPPLYPLILAFCGVFGPAARGVLALGHLAMGVATVWLAWDLTHKCRLHRLQRWLVAALVACDPLLLRASTLVMTETLATLLATAALHQWACYLRQPTPWKAGLLGALMGLGVLCRPGWLVWLLASAAILLICPKHKSRSNSSDAHILGHSLWQADGGEGSPMVCASLALYTVGATLVLVPWVIRNAVQFGWPILTTTHGGYTMLLANNSWLYEHLSQGGSLSDWNPQPFHQAWHQQIEERFLLHKPLLRNMAPQPSDIFSEQPSTKGLFPDPCRWMIDEFGADRWAYQQAMRTIWENPSIFAWAVLLRWGRLWQLAPSRVGDNLFDQVVYYACVGWYGGEFILAIWGIWGIYTKSNQNSILRNTLLLGLVWAVLLTGLHTFYWTEMRMRSPLTTVLALAAAFSLSFNRLSSTFAIFASCRKGENAKPL